MRATRDRLGFLPRLAHCFVVLAVLAWPGPVHAVGAGKWSTKCAWSDTVDRKTAIHMLLLRGDDAPYHSRVMWFGGQPLDVFKGGIWGWKPPAVETCATYPTSYFTAISPPSAGYNVFCSGHSGLADGRAFVAGGHSPVTGAFGEKKATIHTAGTLEAPGSWSAQSQMAAWRWYPTNTTLKDGRVLVTAGYQHHQHRIFGGRRSPTELASPDTVRRWAPVDGGAWDPPVYPERDVNSAPDRPHPCEGHTGTDLTGVSGFENQTLFFGGRRADGQALSDVWALKREPNFTGEDYAYKWQRLSPSGTGPAPRSEHSAVLVGNSSVIIFGGRLDDGTPVNNLFRYLPSAGTWSPYTISGAAPSARMGHIAVYNEMTIRDTTTGLENNVKRMIVYGGVAAADSTPTDMNVYELRLDDPSPGFARWAAMRDTTFTFAGQPGASTPEYHPPGPRFWHRAAAGKSTANLASSLPMTRAKLVYVFGGALGEGAYSDSLWMLCLLYNGKYGWVHRDVKGHAGLEANKPSKRARFSMAFDVQQGGPNEPRLYVHGGEGVGGLADKGIYVIDPWFLGGDNWHKWGEAGYSATGHVAVRDGKETHSRIAEIFDPGSGSWTTLTGNGSRLLQHSYPVTFTVSGGSSAGGRVISASSEDGITRYIDLPGSGSSTANWQQFATNQLGFTPEAGVLYRPNRLMIAGGKSGSTVVGSTRTLRTSSVNSSWVPTAPMEPRYYHNLVLLPDGKVMATGGASTLTNYNVNPIYEPQIWTPAPGESTGTWTTMNTLDASTAVRGYHSTAILLPDGRVLCAGGWQDGGEGEASYHPDQLLADIYCPPYLFKADGNFANRPVVSGAPSRMIWGDPGSYTLCVADTAGVRGASLIRPGMTTHGFDQNQRYLPLTPTQASSPSRILIPPPATSGDAPPGDYLVFVTGSSDGADVPSVATWVSVGGAVPGDSCDVTAPATVVNLNKTLCHEGIDNHYLLTWTAPADDGSLAASRRATIYDIRQSGSPITDANWHLAEPIGGPAPGDPGTTESMVITVTDLTYIRMKSRDNRNGQGNWSGLSNQISLNPVVCGEGGLWGGGGGGGGGSSLRSAAGASSARGSAVSVTQATENSLLNGVSAGTKGRDHLRLGALEVSADGDVMVRVRDTQNHAALIDAVRLVTVDHAPDVTPYVVDGSIMLGTRQVATRVTAGDGTDLSSSLAVGGAYSLGSGDLLDVDLGPGGGASPLIVEAQGRGTLEVLVPDGVGGWQAASRGHPRAAHDEMVVSAPGSDRVRLVSGDNAEIRFVGLLALSQESATIRAAALVSGTQSGVGDISTTLTASDSATTTLVGPDTLTLMFRPDPTLEGMSRDCFLVVEATPLNPGAATLQRREHVPSPLPPRFALRDVQPNPFVKAANIRFELPVGAIVRLEVFDAQGRRIATLANRYYPPGFHTASWAPAESDGNLGPGVYFCRMESGPYRARTRMVLLP